jgi:hypothetical protein
MHGSTLSYDANRSMAMQQQIKLGSTAIGAVAAGDVNGDGFTDLAVMVGSTVTFFLQQMDGSFFAGGAYTLPNSIQQPVALAIGQVDGQGLNDLLVGDGSLAACSNPRPFCNTVYVFLNQSTTN